MGDIYLFTDEDSNLDTPYEWFDDVTGMSGTLPGPNDIAIIQYGQLLTGTLDVGSLGLEQASDGPSLSLTGASTQITASVVVVVGTTVLDDGAVLSIDTLEVFGSGSALLLQNGASVAGNSPDDASITIGTTSGVSLLSVSGLESNFSYTSGGGSLLVGGAMSSDATISITNGGALSGTYADVLIGASDGATATMIVSGAGSVVELNNAVQIGDEGNGSLLVEKGGYASLGGGSVVFVGYTDDSSSPVTATMTVTGASSLISIDGGLNVGEEETSIGHVSVTAGGVLQVAGDTYLLDGAMTVTGAGSSFEGRTLLVEVPGAQSNVIVSNGGSASVVTLDLYAGKVTLANGDITVRRSDYNLSSTTISGYGTVTAGAIYNSGLLNATGGTLRFIGAVDQTGAAHIQAGSTLQFDDSVGNGQTVMFEAATGSLALGDASGFAGLIAGFAQGDTIDLLGDAATKLSLKSGTLTVKNGSKTVATLAFKGGHIGADFKLGSDGHGGSAITYVGTGSVRPFADAVLGHLNGGHSLA